MKHRFFAIMLGVSVLLGALHVVDLICFTEIDTGFVTLGSAWSRYAVLAVAVVALALVPRAAAFSSAQKGVALAMPPLYLALAGFSAVGGLCVWANAVYAFSNPTGVMAYASDTVQTSVFYAKGIAGLSLVLFAAWCVCLVMQKGVLQIQKGMLRMLGFLGVIGFAILAVVRYYETPSSVHRILHVLPIFSMLAALMFAVKLLGVLCKPTTPHSRKALAVRGGIAFLLCTCMELPQTLWQLCSGQSSALDVSLALCVGTLGIAGGALAVKLEKQAKA